MYVVAYSTILSLILLAGCINLCWIRWHYRRKCADVIERMEKQHQRKLETQGDPSPFGVPIKVAAEGMQPAKPKETMALAWDPATLAQVLHNMAVDPATVQSYMPAPYPGVALNYGDQRPPPRGRVLMGNTVVTLSYRYGSTDRRQLHLYRRPVLGRPGWQPRLRLATPSTGEKHFRSVIKQLLANVISSVLLIFFASR